MLSGVGALLDIPRERFPFNVVGNYKFNSCWQKKKSNGFMKEKNQLFKRLNSSHKHVLFNDWEIPDAGEKNVLLYK